MLFLVQVFFLVLQADVLLAVWRPLPYSIRIANHPHTPVPVQAVLPLVPRPPLAGHLESTETLDPLSYADFRREVPYRSKNVFGPEWLSGEEEYRYLQSVPPSLSHHADVKPVTEHIEDDLKYDFRTKTHHFR